MLSNVTLEEPVLADSIIEDEIDYPNLRDSRSRPRSATVSVVEDNIMMEVVAVYESF
jgi:hypothetical protein